MKQLASTLFLLIVIITISSCSSLSPYKVPVLQGNIFEDEDLEKLSEGLTKEQVQFIFGTALIQDPFRTSRWDYFNSVTVGNEVVAENKLTIYFNEDDLVESWVIEKSSEE
ncbi:outer membrane protein assembly factor BamE [Gammaproteobacteria bacterium]|jgi:outer membrane protein assembly factor BamE|nr:outer membrane protein assembly factor BamE [Gammaproteobacteria bacterium]MDC0421014.1 outer membrane protein assembly factor BamE [Gammaproteobacteria bacterium]MDC0536161.1 outer membrane protein assembly factor BamE [Gammaproteobacteria bacterium]|tara:strand:+ start:260 stop:592 length:333 start_codon:yes stop_codon:yes gene_type:complete